MYFLSCEEIKITTTTTIKKIKSTLKKNRFNCISPPHANNYMFVCLFVF